MARILIVDDEPDMRLAVRNVLKLRGYEIAEAGDGPTALELAKASRPDLVLLDMRLPGMDGIEVLSGLKKIDDTVPVVMITGYGHIQSAVDVMKLGASEYLQKPFENAQLVETVKRFAHPAARPASAHPAPVSVPVRPEPAPAPAVQPAAEPALAAPVPAAPRRRSPLLVPALALAALLAGFLLYRQAAAGAAYYKEYPGVAANISALVWAEGKLFAGDWLTQAVYVYAPGKDGLRLESTFPLEKTHISGLAAAGDTLYVADSWKKTIEARRIEPGLPLVRSFPAPGKVSALYYDGEYLWTCDSEGNAVLRRPDSELTPSVSFKLPEKPDQIFKDKGYLWAAVSATGKLYRHKLDDGLTLDGVFTLKTARTGYPLSAFAWREGRLWFARDGLGVVFESGKGELVKE
ncbi:MAG: response regulator [Elusimicrobiales bacterium]|nr:response regulator [Elusimicrobiales bacterium]